MNAIEQMLSSVEWELADPPIPGNGLYATHSGVLDIAGQSLRVYRLNDGRAIIDADDLHRFFGDALK